MIHTISFPGLGLTFTLNRVAFTLLGLACVKLLLDWMFTVWYRRQY